MEFEPKGILTLKGDVSDEDVKNIRDAWALQSKGRGFRIPIIKSTPSPIDEQIWFDKTTNELKYIKDGQIYSIQNSDGIALADELDPDFMENLREV